MSKTPNLLFVFTDEHRASAMGCENPEVHTPHLDALVREGTRFSRAFSNTPVCTPARGTLLTGLFPWRHGAALNDVPVRTDVTSIAHVLRDARYRCGYIGKWHLGGIPRHRFTPPGPERLGFDDYWAVWNCHHQYLEPKFFRDAPEPIFAEGYEPAVQTDLALAFLREHGEQHPDQPFALYLSWGPPHDPYFPLPPGYEDAYDPARITLPPNCADTAAHRRDLAAYHTHVTACDAQFGRLTRFLDESGLAENTLVVFTADHGSMLGSQGSYHKQQPWQESARIPLILRGPGIPAGRVEPLLISLVDLMPTILGLMGAPVPPGDGVDLSAAVRGDAAAPRPESVYLAEHVCVDQAIQLGLTPWRGVVTDRYTYARNLDGPWVLYDDRADPYQQHNRVADPECQEVLAELDALTRRWMEQVDDPLLPPSEFLARNHLEESYAARQAHLHGVPGAMGGDYPKR